tara:strand:- start:8196 stop:8420 length:225 start_codon:yes stop_codon:yes gene_type:complete
MIEKRTQIRYVTLYAVILSILLIVLLPHLSALPEQAASYFEFPTQYSLNRLNTYEFSPRQKLYFFSHQDNDLCW